MPLCPLKEQLSYYGQEGARSLELPRRPSCGGSDGHSLSSVCTVFPSACSWQTTRLVRQGARASGTSECL